MSENLYFRKNVRLPHYIGNELEIISKKNKISVNKLIQDILINYLAEYNGIENKIDFKELLLKIDKIENQLVSLQKNYSWLNSLTKQIFVNSGFARNRNLKEDLVYQEFVNSRYEK